MVLPWSWALSGEGSKLQLGGDTTTQVQLATAGAGGQRVKTKNSCIFMKSNSKATFVDLNWKILCLLPLKCLLCKSWSLASDWCSLSLGWDRDLSQDSHLWSQSGIPWWSVPLWAQLPKRSQIGPVGRNISNIHTFRLRILSGMEIQNYLSSNQVKKGHQSSNLGQTCPINKPVQ